jgi:hypothetical protein
VLGRPAIGPLAVVALVAALVWLPSTPLRGSWWPGRAVTSGALVGLAAVALALDGGSGLPRNALTYSGADVGSPFIATAKAASIGPVVPLQATSSGTYQVVATYTLTGVAPGRVTMYCDATPAGHDRFLSRGVLIPPAGHAVTLSVDCPRSGAVSVGFTTPARTRLAVTQVALSKVAS